jgi:acetyl-CoA acyltransferase
LTNGLPPTKISAARAKSRPKEERMRRKVFASGVAHTKYIGKFHPDFIWKKHPDFGKRQNPSIEDLIKQAALGAVADAGLEPKQVDRGFVGNFVAECFVSQGHLGPALAGSHPDFEGKPFYRVEGACASGGLAVIGGIEAIQAGADVVLVVGAEVQTVVSAKEGAAYLARASHYKTQRSLDEFTFPCLFARRTKMNIQGGRMTWEDLARVVAKAYANAGKNPFAHMHKHGMTYEQALKASDDNPYFIENPEYKEWLKVSDCSQVSDGASGIVLVSEDGLKRGSRGRADVIELAGYGLATGSLYEIPDPVKLGTTMTAARKAYGMAGLKPADVKVAEVHDCFSITEVLMYEAMGFADEGKGPDLVRKGETEIKSRIPVNTGGGLIAFGHPTGATGVKQVGEMLRQLKGRCGDYQVQPIPAVGAAANMGGDDRTSVVTIWKK